MARQHKQNVSIPIMQVRTIDVLNISANGGDWRAVSLARIAEHIGQEPNQVNDHYEVKFDGRLLAVDLSEDDSVPMHVGDVAWDDPDLDLDIPN